METDKKMAKEKQEMLRKIKEKEEDMQKLPTSPHDWTKTGLYEYCKTLKRLKKPSLVNAAETNLIKVITEMRVNP